MAADRVGAIPSPNVTSDRTRSRLGHPLVRTSVFQQGCGPGRTLSFFSSAGASSSMRTLDRATFDDATFEVAPIIVAGAKPAAEVRPSGGEAVQSRSVRGQRPRDKVT